MGTCLCHLPKCRQCCSWLIAFLNFYFLDVLMSCGKANVCIPACQILSVCAEAPGWVSSWFKEPCNVSEGMGEHGEEKTAK